MLLKFFIGTGIFFLIALCTWLILIILMQKPSAQGGMGAALGGGMAESAFGGEASNVLTRWTVYSVIAYFLLTLMLSLCQIPQAHQNLQAQELKPIAVEEPKTAGSLTTLPNEEGSTPAEAPNLKIDEVSAEVNLDTPSNQASQTAPEVTVQATESANTSDAIPQEKVTPVQAQ